MDIFWILVLAAFMFGGLCGIILMALVQINRYEPPRLDPRGLSPLERITQ